MSRAKRFKKEVVVDEDNFYFTLIMTSICLAALFIVAILPYIISGIPDISSVDAILEWSNSFRVRLGLVFGGYFSLLIVFWFMSRDTVYVEV